MCPEPHCLVPIVASKAEQVVLIGDHKQLRPIIKCKEAAEMGLEKSLFEKQWLSENTQEVEKVMLKRQYRMVSNLNDAYSFHMYYLRARMPVSTFP